MRDALGHVGLAREAAALFDLPWAPPSPDAASRVAKGTISDYASVVVEDTERCPHYGAAVVVDLTVGPSPEPPKISVAQTICSSSLVVSSCNRCSAAAASFQ